HRAAGQDWTGQDWSAYAWRAVFADGGGRASVLQTHSTATAALLAGLEAATRAYAGVKLSTDDLVHGDFLPENVLVLDGRVTAVIDFAQAGCGTRAIDLAHVLAWWHDEIDSPLRIRLSDRIRDISGEAGLAICLQVLDMVAYVIAHYSPESVEHAVRVGWQLLTHVQAAS
ncbi:MAG: hypothetical protein AVDCRST_MAG88-3590, partial [uncultured Thermomicrobiales bacterium]